MLRPSPCRVHLPPPAPLSLRRPPFARSIFHRFNQPYGSKWSWDFRSLCQPAGSEYVAFNVPPSASASPSPAAGDYAERIIFNICGSVAGPVIAPYNSNNPNSNMTLPQPHSHGTAIQIVDSPVDFEAGYICPDTDTCDQATNPGCLPYSLNYNASRNDNNPNTGQPIAHNPAMEALCAGPSPPASCFVAAVRCTGNIELLSYYKGDTPVFSLFDEGTAAGVTVASPANGINISYTPSLAFKGDAFPCNALDPATGEAVVRTINLYIACNAAGDPGDALTVVGYSEQGQCQYYITAAHKLACGVPGDPYDPGANPSFTVAPTAAPAAFNLNANQLVGAVVGAVVGITVLMQTLVGLAFFCFLVPAATRAASLEAAYARCCCCCGGGARSGPLYSPRARAPTPRTYRDSHGKSQELAAPTTMYADRALAALPQGAGGEPRFAGNPLNIVNAAEQGAL